MTEAISIAILIGAGLIVISVFTSVLSFRIGAPLLLVFLGVGLLAGEDGPGGIEFSDFRAAYFIGSLALAVILFDSGVGTRLKLFRAAGAPAITLATFGVLLTAGLVAVPAKLLLGVDWLEALLLGSIIGSTDAAAVFFLLRVGGIEIRERVRGALEIESGSNDPMAIFMTVTLLELMKAGTDGVGGASMNFAASFILQMGLGLVIGAAAGYAIVKGMNRLRLEPGLYPVVVLGLALCVFAVTSLLGGSGFLAVYVAGLVMGNMPFRGDIAYRRFQEGLTWLAQITMFLVLGLLATPSEFIGVAWQAAGVGLALIVFARPLAVWLCLLPFGFRQNETMFIAWVGLRGAVSILLAILPIVAGISAGSVLFNAVFIVVLTSLLIQGWTIRPMAQWLGLVVPPQIGPVEKVELELPGDARHELVAYRIAPGSPVAKGERIPRWARPSLVVREGRSMRIHEVGRPEAGDQVYIFTVPRFTPLLDRLFASPAELTERDLDYFGEFTVEPQRCIGDLAKAYDIAIAETDAAMTIGAYLERYLASPLGRGDRLLLAPIELIVRDVDEDGHPTSVGLALEPSAASAPRLPIFQNFRQIAAAWQERLSRKTPPALDNGGGGQTPEERL
ncbi:MAG: potassium/proton antiporter [Pseudomonadota bacterium]|nr:potassium/proton antiporter [Pseudomonadota bacterium]